jgi:RNA polymerase sigma factor (sigma-70 family)
MLRTQSDARLVDLVRAGHASAFEAIVQRYRKQLLAYCSRLLPASRAEDAVQQTFLKAYQAMISGDAELNLRPWLYRIAHNASLNLLRQNGWSHEQLDENMDGVQRPDQAFELRERLRTTVNAVKALPERQRNAVLLREIDGLSYEEIASALGVGDGAVRQLLHRARATLRAGMTAVTPVGLVDRLAAALASGGADPSARVAEAAAGIGLGTGAAKLGAAVLATGVIATGAVTVPLHRSHHAGSARATADETLSGSSSGGSGSSAGSGSSTRNTQVDDRTGKGGSGSGSHSRGGSHHDSGHGGGSGSGSDDSPGSGDRHSGSSGGRGGGSDDSDDSGDGSHTGSSQRGSGGDDGTNQRGDSGGGGSGGGGSDDSGDGSHSGSGDGTTTPLAGIPTNQDGGDRHGGGDPVVTAPTTTPVPPVVDDSGDDGGGGGDSGSGDGN